MKRVRLEQLLKAVDGTAVGFSNQDIEFESIATDSRSIQPQQLFWALQGDNHDGHDYVRDANKRGAVASVVAAKNAGKSKGASSRSRRHTGGVIGFHSLVPSRI